jgi:aspartyl-tRNA(Asn)/glutamyl-tRNA(Gln) amidotransferase subunit C
MSLTIDDVKKIAHLARLNMPENELQQYTTKLSNILHLVEEMNKADTSHIEAISHALDLSQRERPDAVTEPNQREAFQKIAPKVEAGLYLVPKVID